MGTLRLSPFCLAVARMAKLVLLSMASQAESTPARFMSSTTGVTLTPPNGMLVLTYPAFNPCDLAASAVPLADADEDGEIPYPRLARLVAPWDLRKEGPPVFNADFSKSGTLGPRVENMLVFGCWFHSTPS